MICYENATQKLAANPPHRDVPHIYACRYITQSSPIKRHMGTRAFMAFMLIYSYAP